MSVRNGISTQLDGRTSFQADIIYDQCSCLADHLVKKCSGDPLHVQLLDGRAASPAVFLDKLCDAICMEVKLQQMHDSEGQVCSMDLGLKQLQSLDLNLQQYVCD